jgi:hypothetical protein
MTYLIRYTTKKGKHMEEETHYPSEHEKPYAVNESKEAEAENAVLLYITAMLENGSFKRMEDQTQASFYTEMTQIRPFQSFPSTVQEEVYTLMINSGAFRYLPSAEKTKAYAAYTLASQNGAFQDLKAPQWWEMLEAELDEKLTQSMLSDSHTLELTTELRKVIAVGKTIPRPALSGDYINKVKEIFRIFRPLQEKFDELEDDQLQQNPTLRVLARVFANHLIRYAHLHDALEETLRNSEFLAKKAIEGVIRAATGKYYQDEKKDIAATIQKLEGILCLVQEDEKEAEAKQDPAPLPPQSAAGLAPEEDEANSWYQKELEILNAFQGPVAEKAKTLLKNTQTDNAKQLAFVLYYLAKKELNIPEAEASHPDDWQVPLIKSIKSIPGLTAENFALRANLKDIKPLINTMEAIEEKQKQIKEIEGDTSWLSLFVRWIYEHIINTPDPQLVALQKEMSALKKNYKEGVEKLGFSDNIDKNDVIAHCQLAAFLDEVFGRLDIPNSPKEIAPPHQAPAMQKAAAPHTEQEKTETKIAAKREAMIRQILDLLQKGDSQWYMLPTSPENQRSKALQYVRKALETAFSVNKTLLTEEQIQAVVLALNAKFAEKYIYETDGDHFIYFEDAPDTRSAQPPAKAKESWSEWGAKLATSTINAASQPVATAYVVALTAYEVAKDVPTQFYNGLGYLQNLRASTLKQDCLNGEIEDIVRKALEKGSVALPACQIPNKEATQKPIPSLFMPPLDDSDDEALLLSASPPSLRI